MAILKDITIGKYIETDSVLHRLDPRTKFAAALALMTALFAAGRSLAPLVLLALFLGFLMPLSKLPAAIVLRNMRPFAWLFSFTILLWAFWVPPPPFTVLWRIAYFDLIVTAEGLQSGLFFSVRLCLIIVISSLVTLTTSPMDLTWGLERLFRPLRRIGLPAQELAMMITIALRFVPVLVEEAERLHKAQLARGADHSGGPLKRARSLIPLLVPLLISTFDRADRLAVAMESRCYGCVDERTSFRSYRFGLPDLAAALAVAAVIAAGFAFPSLEI